MEKQNRVGEKHTTNEGYEIEIIEYFGRGDCTIKLNETLILRNITYQHIKNGSIKNPYHPSVYGIGYIGVGKYKTKINNKSTKIYITWKNLLMRCYYSKYQTKYPTYVGCTVDERWLNFQVFAAWFEEHYIKGCDLDKDLLIKGNKIYSPRTCCFIPLEINKLLVRNSAIRGGLPIGVTKHYNKFQAYCNVNGKQEFLGTFKTPELAFKAYKKVKEEYIRDTAKLCKGIITDQAYEALINYKVEITD